MYSLENTTRVDIDREVAAVVAFLETRWEPVSRLLAIVTQIALEAQTDARLWFDHYSVSNALALRLEARRDALALMSDESGLLGSFDASKRMLYRLFSTVPTIHEATVFEVDWDYSGKTKNLTARLAQRYSELRSAQPLGWDAFRAGYTDHAGTREYAEGQQQRDEADFQGADSHGGGAPAFPCRVALPYVMYDEVCQGRPRNYVLVGAIYGHFLRVVEHNNTVDILRALVELSLRDEETNPVWQIEATSSNPIVAVMLENANEVLTVGGLSLQTAYANALEAQRVNDALSAEERHAAETKRKDRMAVFMASLSDPKNRQAEKQRRDSELRHMRERLLAMDQARID